MQWAEVRSGDAPVQLLADQRQIEQLGQRCLEEVADLFARVGSEGRGDMGGARRRSHAHSGGVSQPVAPPAWPLVSFLLALRIDRA
jgi:hypothetical protein